MGSSSLVLLIHFSPSSINITGMSSGWDTVRNPADKPGFA
jgi:hypothetical protein